MHKFNAQAADKQGKKPNAKSPRRKENAKAFFGMSSSDLERLIAEADVVAGRVEDFDKFMARFRDEHKL